MAWGWALLWSCSRCGQLWEGYVTCGTRSPDCVVKYWGSEDDWFAGAEADYERFTEENRLEEKARHLKGMIEREGYEASYFALYSPWDDLVEWKGVLVGKKKRLLRSVEEKAIVLILARNGDVCPISDPQVMVGIAIGHTQARKVW